MAKARAIDVGELLLSAPEKRFNLDRPMDTEFKCAKCGEWTHGSEAFGTPLCGGCAHEYHIEKQLTADAIRNNAPYPSPFDIKLIASAAIPDATAYFVGQGGQAVKMENVGKMARANLEGELLNGKFLEGMLHAIKSTGHDPRQLKAVVDQIERIIDRLHTEKGTTTADMVKVRTEEKRIFDAAQDTVLKLNRRVNDLEAALNTATLGRKADKAEWDEQHAEMTKLLAEANETIQPRRLQAKVREQWPTIESELQYFLEWFVETRNIVTGPDKVDVPEVVGQYVALTKED